MGDNGFDSSEPRDANILSYEHRRHPLKICNNIFWGANHYCGLHPDCWADITGNMVYIHKGQKLSYSLSAAFPTIYANTEADIHAYKKQTNDSSSIFLIDDLENYQTELQNIRLKAAALLTSTVQYE
jgi:hypothetical protein